MAKRLPASEITTRHMIYYNGEWCNITSVMRWPHGEVVFTLEPCGDRYDYKAKCKRTDIYNTMEKS